jgi:hypothetical protein
MRYPPIIAPLLLFVFSWCAHAQTGDSAVVPLSQAAASGSAADDADASKTAPGPDTVKNVSAQRGDSLSSPNAQAASAAQNQPQKLKLFKRKYNSRQQVLLATGMMIFVIGIMSMAQQWNPR